MKKSEIYFLAWRVARAFTRREWDVDKAWERLKPVTRRAGRPWPARLSRYAAVAALLLVAGGGGVAWWQLSRGEEEAMVVASSVIRPELVLPDGERILLDGDGERQAEGATGVRFATDSARGVTRLDATSAVDKGSASYHQLNVPKGCEYAMRLPDGSLVWLNSETTLRFPLAFAADDRAVYLEGEAYFEVTRDDNAPFRVISGEKTVTVLGTRFNVSAYADDPTWHATLVDGRVRVSFRGVDRELSPSRQCVIDNSTGDIALSDVETYLYTSWKEEQVYFKGSTLEEIAKKLARWYDFSIIYADDRVKHMKFRGGINKNRPLEETLRHLERTTNIAFTVDGRTIIAREVPN